MAVGVTFSSTEDALAVLPQYLEAANSTSAGPGGWIHMRTIRRQVSVVIGLKGTFRRMPQRCRREPYHAPGDKTKSLAGDGSSEALRPNPQSVPGGQDRRFVGLAVLGSLLSRRSRRRQTTVVVRSHDALSG